LRLLCLNERRREQRQSPVELGLRGLPKRRGEAGRPVAEMRFQQALAGDVGSLQRRAVAGATRLRLREQLR
jgi:hypothetical protein